MKISIKMNLLSGFLLGGFLFLLAFSGISLNTIIKSMNSVNLVYSHLDNIRQCENLLLSELAEAQQIILRDKGTVDEELLVSLRLKNAGLKNEISSIEKAELPAGIVNDLMLAGKFRTMYASVDENLLQRIFNREIFDSSAVSEQIFADYNDLQSGITAYRLELGRGLETVAAANKTTQRNQIIIFTVITGLMSVLIISMIAFIRKSVLGPVKETAREMLNLAAGRGDLSFRFNTDAKDEIGEMGVQFNGFIKKTSALESISTLKVRSGTVSGFIIELDTGIAGIFDSVKSLEDKLLSVNLQVEAASKNTEKLNSMKRRLEQTAGENHTVAETPNDYIEHFRSRMY